MGIPLTVLSTSSPSFADFHTPVHFPLHRGPSPPPLIPSLSFRISPTSFTLASSESNTSTTVMFVAVFEVGENVNVTRYCFEACSETVQSLVNSVAIAARNARGHRSGARTPIHSLRSPDSLNGTTPSPRSTLAAIQDPQHASLRLCARRPLAKPDQELEGPAAKNGCSLSNLVESRSGGLSNAGPQGSITGWRSLRSGIVLLYAAAETAGGYEDSAYEFHSTCRGLS